MIPADPVTQYALDVGAGRIIAGPHVRNACRRHLDDLENGPKRGLAWDVAAAQRVIGYFRDVLRLSHGDFSGLPFVLDPWQEFIVGSLFGWKKADESRRFRTAYVETAKGSGKTPLGAGLGNYMTTSDGENQAEGYVAATKKDQAMVAFRHAVAQVKQSPALKARTRFSGGVGHEWNIAHLASGSFFRPIASEDTGSGQSGPLPHFILIDELHEHRTNAVIEWLRAGFKSRRQPLLFAITNSGVDRQSVCWEYHEYARQVAAQELEDDSFFGYVCALDEGEDPFEDERCWIKTNPSLPTIPGLDYLRGQVLEARGMPSKESLVRRLNFCEWVDAESPWIPGHLWRAAEADEEEFDKLFPAFARPSTPLFLGLDLSESKDLTALGKVWRFKDGREFGESLFWTPKDTIAQRGMRDRVPYDTWAERGFINALSGPTIDYEFIALYIAELLGTHNVQGLAFDQYRMAQMTQAFDRIGVTYHIHGEPGREVGLRLVRHGQGHSGGLSDKVLWMERSIGALETAIMKGTLRVRRNPVLTWNSSSAVLKQDAQGNRIWSKRRSTGRIDGIVALCMARGLAEHAPAKVEPPRIRFTVVE